MSRSRGATATFLLFTTILLTGTIAPKRALAEAPPVPPAVLAADSLLRRVLDAPAPLDTATVRRLTRSLRVMNEAGFGERALPLALRFRERCRKDFGVDSYETTRAHEWVLSTRDAAGQKMSDEALADARESVRLRRRFPGDDSTWFGRSMGNLALRLLARGRLKESLDLYLEADGLYRRHLPPGNSQRATNAENVGNTLLMLGRYEEARPYIDGSLAVLRDSAGTRNAPWSNVGAALRVRASLALRTGDVRSAERFLNEARSMHEREPAAEKGDWLAGVHEELSELAFVTGNASTAAAEADSALAVRLRYAGSEAPNVSRSVYNRARAHRLTGDFASAKNELERADSIMIAFGGGSPLRRLELLAELANVNVALGERHAALETLRVVERLAVAERGASSPELGIVIVPLAALLADLGRPAESESLLSRHVRSVEAVDGNSPMLLVPALTEWARALLDQGRLHAAESKLDRLERLIGSSSAQWTADAAVADMRAHIATLRGRKADAVRFARLALQLSQDAGGEMRAQRLARLSSALLAAGHSAAAFDTACVAEAIGRARLRETIRGLSEAEGLAYAGRRPAGLDPLLSALASNAKPASHDVARAWTEVLRSRALVLDEAAARARLRGTADSAESASRAPLDRARERLARLIVRDLRLDPDAGPGALDSARVEVERAERRWLATSPKSPAGRDDDASFDRIANALPRGAALVAFVRHGNDEGPLHRERYAAFTLADRSAGPTLVDLGDAASIDDLVLRWRERAGTPPRGAADEALARRAGLAVRIRVWDPLPVAVRRSATVFVVADGAIHLLNLAALPSDEHAWLAETGPVFLGLGTERDLLEKPEGSAGRGLLAIGAPDFSASGSLVAGNERNEVAPALLRGGCTPSAVRAWSPLPASAAEAESVAALWRRTARPDSSARVLLGAAASEREFRTAAPGRRVLHVATHAIAFGIGCAPAPAGTRGIGGVVIEGHRPVAGNPPRALASVTCLALAGANLRATRDDDDGLLLPDEVATLDLAGVECVVLSACESGVGEVRPGEGVFGLRRALRVAGAHASVASLWPVRDAEARAWMQRFYEARQSRGASLAEAVRVAMRETIAARRAAGLDTHPFHWGAFVEVGDRHAIELEAADRLK